MKVSTPRKQVPNMHSEALNEDNDCPSSWVNTIVALRRKANEMKGQWNDCDADEMRRRVASLAYKRPAWLQ